MYPGTLVSGFANISVNFNKLANNFKPVDRFFKRVKILLVILLHEKFLQFDTYIHTCLFKLIYNYINLKGRV